MFRLRNKDAKFPELYPKVDRKDPTTKDKGWDKVGDFTLRDKVDFMPQKGLQEQFCASECNLIFLCGAATMGKEQPYDAKVLTPTGFVDMGSLKVGDTICGANGTNQEILAIFEQGIKDVYKIHLEDGTSTECGLEHLWRASIRRGHTPFKDYGTYSFKQIMWAMDNGYNVCLPYCKPIQFDSEDLPIGAYTLGAYLGDGCSPLRGNPQIACHIDNVDILSRIESEGYNVSKIPSHKISYIISGNDINTHLKSLGLYRKKSYEKFIPEIYKKASIQDRLNILQGLLDTDGCVTTQGLVIFATSSITLANDVMWVCRSLGGRCSMKSYIPKYVHNGEKKVGRVSYHIRINMPPQYKIVHTHKKAERYKIKHFQRRHSVVSYELVGKKQCRCILVSNPDHLYITNDFIVTHNTYAMFLKALNGLGDNHIGYTARMISVRLQDSKKGSSIFRDAVEVCGNFAGCEYNSSDYPTFTWKQWNANLQLIHANFNVDNPNEWEEFRDMIKKQQSSYIAIDEATEIKQFKMFNYIFSRNRDSSGMTPCMALSFNPEHNHFTTAMLKDAGYLDENWYFKPKMNGVVKYFYIAGDTENDIIWGNTPEEVIERAGITITDKDRKAGITERDIVKSFCALTGEASDNLKLVAATKGGSVANLHAVGKTQRDVLKGGYFGPVDNEELNVTRQMIHDLWTNPINDDENMYATLDVSGGEKGQDACPLIIWKGLNIRTIKWFRAEQDNKARGDYEYSNQLVNWVANTLQEYNVPIEHFAFDATGMGYHLKGFAKGYPVTFNKGVVQEYDENGNPVTFEQYYNIRSQIIGKTKALLEMGKISCSLDKETIVKYGHKQLHRRFIDILFDEMNIFISTKKNHKIYYRNKVEYKAKFKSSPDLMDAICLRAVFEFDARPKKQPTPQVPDDAYNGLYRSYSGRERSVWV
jgi:hypothetical protein